jgi:hypothetical protein
MNFIVLHLVLEIALDPSTSIKWFLEAALDLAASNDMMGILQVAENTSHLIIGF